ncbi:MAG: hypothetical protein IPL59_01400 [Candidatus Competibacteraceae bacterium]|uniref:Uncharacterized protein n=1 Tax=Candidatus Contendobacter odensis Run_B_J11 TaxID=1400861 RepID=A0A7U7GDM2_9GAMM|nr:hypothetical protein [Candidatus Contendobacter odensis]MBK8533875.1 hypothetical protein [Candidatus Competibacteraceae bacterium]MBK8751270.1 hypothetical protein [Candidatus Competibacteraceae bacterium]CDH46212.1 conserved hypothetical protein [Candidatus Contendobacter odensis Run_B_J11]
MNDEIIDEVRAIREAHAARFNYDLKAIFTDIQRGEAELEKQGFKLIIPPTHPADLPESSLKRIRFTRG